MVVALSIHVIGAKALDLKMKKGAANLVDWTDYFDDIEDFITARIEQSFETEGKASGAGPWLPLSPRWAARKSKIAPGKPILQLTGNMRLSLIDEGHPQALRRRRKNQFIFGSANPLVAIHTEGRGFFLDPRPILILTEVDKKALRDTASRFLAKQLGKAGLLN